MQYKQQTGSVGVEETPMSLSRWACSEMSSYSEYEKSHWFAVCLPVETAPMIKTYLALTQDNIRQRKTASIKVIRTMYSLATNLF